MALKLNQMTVRRIGGVKVSSILIKWFLVRQLMASLQIGGARVSRRERGAGGDMRGGTGPPRGGTKIFARARRFSNQLHVSLIFSLQNIIPFPYTKVQKKLK